MTISAPSARFPTTAWSCLKKAADRDDPDFVAAVNRLITSYWKPVFHFLRAKGRPAQQAEDLIQEFFLDFLVQDDWLKRADPQQGRFRNFLLTVLKRFVHDQTIGARVQKKFEGRFVSVETLLSDEDRTWEPPAGESPEQVFDKQWKIQTRETTRQNLKAYYEGLGESQVYEVFAAYYFVEQAANQPSQEELAARFGLTRDKVRAILTEAKKRYERLLRQEIRDQGCPEEDLDEELRDLL